MFSFIKLLKLLYPPGFIKDSYILLFYIYFFILSGNTWKPCLETLSGYPVWKPCLEVTCIIQFNHLFVENTLPTCSYCIVFCSSFA